MVDSRDRQLGLRLQVLLFAMRPKPGLKVDMVKRGRESRFISTGAKEMKLYT